jgi:hypothetical protein
MTEQPEPRGSCLRVESCLFGAVALFVVMLIGLLVLAAIRFQDRPSSVDERPTPITLAPRP